MAEPGHVFVVRGDLTTIACDAWLLPTDYTRHVTASWWTPNLTPLLEAAGCWHGRRGADPGSTMDDQRAIALDPGARAYPGGATRRAAPVPCLTRIGAGRNTALDWYLTSVRCFVDVALADLEAHGRYLARRARPLLALPLVGTGQGGKRRQAGAMADALMQTLHDIVREREVDLALVARTDRDFAGAQAARSSLVGFEALPPAVLDRARALAPKVAAGQVVVFLGAGVSAGAGLPLWSELLGDLARRAGVGADDRREVRHFSHLGPMDQAEYLAARLRASGGIGQAVVQSLEGYSAYSLAHGLIAGLPIAEAITTNYDRLFETACAAAGRPCAVLPYAPGVDHDRWLLKMHGCLDRPDDIVLTRESYLRYAERNAALAGIVQAMLITRHMLYLGFGLGDDNFLRIVDAVRRAVRPGTAVDDEAPLGTAVMLTDNPLLRTLWHEQLEFLCLSDDAHAVTIAEAARRVEILLDALSFHAAAPAHLLDARYAPLRSDADDALARHLWPLSSLDADDPARQSAAWPLVAELIGRLGGSTRPRPAGKSTRRSKARKPKKKAAGSRPAERAPAPDPSPASEPEEGRPDSGNTPE